MAGRVVTIEICSTAIKLMETEGASVTRWATSLLEPGTFNDEILSDPPALSAAVKEFMASNGINSRNVTASVSGLYSLSRIVIVPVQSGGAVTQQAVLERANEVMPFSEDELYLSWQNISAVEGGQQVLVVGIPRDIIDAEVRALKMGGVNPRALDLKAMALARAVNKEQTLILNIEPTTFDIVIVVNGVAEVMHTTAWREGDLSPEEKAEHLAVALELAVGFYNSHNPGIPLDPATPLFITGTVSGDVTLREKFKNRIVYPIEPLAPPLEYPEHFPVSQYAVNIGLALKGMTAAKSPVQSRTTLDINLLPQIYRPWKPSTRQRYFFVVIIALIALLFPLFQLYSGAAEETTILEKRYSLINTELQRRQLELAKRDPLQKVINEYQTIVAMGGGIVEDVNVINSTATEFGIEMQTITHRGNAISFNCQADSYLTFRNFIAALKESGQFSLVTSPAERFPYLTGGDITITLQPKSR